MGQSGEEEMRAFGIRVAPLQMNVHLVEDIFVGF